MIEQRIADLEFRLAFQDDAIRQLNDVLCRQQDQIDRLQLVYRELLQVVELLLDHRNGDVTGQRPPPHY